MDPSSRLDGCEIHSYVTIHMRSCFLLLLLFCLVAFGFVWFFVFFFF